MPNNRHYIYFDDKYILGKTDEKKDEYDIKEVLIPSFITQIGSYAFSETLIDKISIPSNVTRILKGADYQLKIWKFIFYS